MRITEAEHVNSTQQIEEVIKVFGGQSRLAEAIGLKTQHVSSWKQQDLGVPPKHHRKIWDAAKKAGLENDLPWWFPRYLEKPGKISA